MESHIEEAFIHENNPFSKKIIKLGSLLEQNNDSYLAIVFFK